MDTKINFLFVNKVFKSFKETAFLLFSLLGSFTKNKTAKKAIKVNAPVAKKGYHHECSPKKPPNKGPAEIPKPIAPSKSPTAL
jgi:hypothetical protein